MDAIRARGGGLPLVDFIHGFTIVLGMRDGALCFRVACGNGFGKGWEDLPVIS